MRNLGSGRGREDEEEEGVDVDVDLGDWVALWGRSRLMLMLVVDMVDMVVVVMRVGGVFQQPRGLVIDVGGMRSLGGKIMSRYRYIVEASPSVVKVHIGKNQKIEEEGSKGWT